MDEKDKKNQKKQEAAVQAELEQQLRDLGVGVNELKDTVGDAFRHGFEGREDELGRQVNDVASGVTAVLNSVVGEVANAFQDAMDLERGAGREERAGRRREREHRRWQQREARRNARADQSGDGAPYDYSGRWQTGPGRVSWGRYRSDRAASAPEGEGGYVKAIRWSARKRFGIGLALAVTCGILAFSFFVGGIACFVSTEIVLADSVAETALAWTGIGLMVGGGLCTVGAVSGGEQLEASQLLNRCAAAFEGLDLSDGVDLDDLAGLLQMKRRKLRKRLRELINKGWLTGWLDERGNCLYLSAADYRAAHNIPPQPAPEPKAQPQPQPEPEAGAAPDKTVLHLETAQRFAHVLEGERRLMADPAAAEELKTMQNTTEAICAWLESHPESAPKARRFAEYYIPTTLKLLHTYNDVQGQQGDNAEAIRRDIGGILHTLNTAYANLYDTLLGDAALDVSSEIAALEGMLASDGLTGNGFSAGEDLR